LWEEWNISVLYVVAPVRHSVFTFKRLTYLHLRWWLLGGCPEVTASERKQLKWHRSYECLAVHWNTERRSNFQVNDASSKSDDAYVITGSVVHINPHEFNNVVSARMY
jgi:hypothetical protein